MRPKVRLWYGWRAQTLVWIPSRRINRLETSQRQVDDPCVLSMDLLRTSALGFKCWMAVSRSQVRLSCSLGRMPTTYCTS